jgi:hypothetical protein
MSQEPANKPVFALKFPNGAAPLGGVHVATNAPEVRVGAVPAGTKLTVAQASALLRRARIDAVECSVHESHDYWVLRYRIGESKERG